MTSSGTLDILITRSLLVTEEVPNLSFYRFTDTDWGASTDQLIVQGTDADGVTLPYPDGFNETRLGLTHGGGTMEFLITAYRVGATSFNQPNPNFRRIDAMGIGTFLAGYSGELLIRLGPVGRTQTITEQQDRLTWARREDFRAADFVDAGPSGLVEIQDSRYLVHPDNEHPWSTGESFVDEEGRTRTVQGVGQVERNYRLELLARRIG